MQIPERLRKPIIALAISAAGVTGVANYEGFRKDAYVPIPGDLVTVGYGTTKYEDNSPVKPGDTVTKARAEILLKHDLNTFEKSVKNCVKVPLYQYEYDAYVSLSYNIGTKGFCNSSIPKKLAEYNYEAACKTILEFNKFRDCTKPKVLVNGVPQCPYVVLKGLDNRRKQEYQMCIGG